ncbi:MAG: hypothetical protein GQ574_18100 [Crocinitomix sp.]|nr:hypothetical protein [Crocinitomix sp.]
MSYTIFIQKFKEGEPSPFNRSELETIISKHGKMSEEEFGVEILTEIDMFENADLNGEGTAELSGISFHRPIHCIALQNLIFDVLEVNGTCFFDQNFSYLQTRTLNQADFPEDLIENAEDGITLVQSATEIWPLEE